MEYVTILGDDDGAGAWMAVEQLADEDAKDGRPAAGKKLGRLRG